MSRKAYYPLFADLQGRRCLVIGGGAVAQRKVTTLLGYGAEIILISPTATRRLMDYARQGRIRHIQRAFRPEDLKGVWLVYASTDDERINALVFRSATKRRIFTNVVDQPSLCSFIAPAILRRDPLAIAVSTGGASPTIAKRIRSQLRRTVGVEYPRLLRLLASLREPAKHRLPTYQDRKRYFERLLEGRVPALVRAGRTQAARRQALALLNAQAAERN